MSGWMAQERVLPLKFEEILASPEKTIRNIAEHTELLTEPASPILPNQTRSIWKGRFDRLLPGHPQSTAVNSKARVSHASAAERAATAAAISPRVRDLAERLGYSFEAAAVIA